MRSTSTRSEGTAPAVELREEESSAAARGLLLDAGLRRDRRWRELRRQSLLAELRALDRMPWQAAILVFILAAVSSTGRILYDVAIGDVKLTADGWSAVLFVPLITAFIAALLTRTFFLGVSQGLHRIIRRRAKNDHSEP